MQSWIDDQMVEHLAIHFAELGDTELERMCDEVLAGQTDDVLLLGIIKHDSSMQEWLAAGRNLGWKARAL